MSWARLDDCFPEHPKADQLSDRAWRLHVTALCYCTRNLTDGCLSDKGVRAMVASLKASKKHISELEAAGLWEQGDGFWNVHDYLDWNPSADEVKKKRVSARERMQRARSRERADEHDSERSQDVPDGIGSNELEKKHSVAESDITLVYDHWRDKRGKTRSNYDRLSPGRRRKISARLREFSAVELVQAVDAVALDPWAERAHHDDITVIFRSQEQVEKFLEMSDRPRNNGSLPPLEKAKLWVKQVGWDYPDHALWEELGKFDLDAKEKQRIGQFVLEVQQEMTPA